MNTRQVTKDGQTYLECVPSEWRLESEREALELVAACGENETDRLLLHAESLTEDFYRLRTGLAGTILLKFDTYRIQVAAVIPLERVNQGRFQEMVLELNRGDQFRVFQNRDQAEAWLVGLSQT
jgi:Domain of unknown function (DUF4180)